MNASKERIVDIRMKNNQKWHNVCLANLIL